MRPRILADVDTGIDDACALIHLVGSDAELGNDPEAVFAAFAQAAAGTR